MQVITIVFLIELDIISTLFCVQVIIMVFWIVLDLFSTFVCMQVIYMLFWGEFDLIFKKWVVSKHTFYSWYTFIVLETDFLLYVSSSA